MMFAGLPCPTCPETSSSQSSNLWVKENLPWLGESEQLHGTASCPLTHLSAGLSVGDGDLLMVE